MNWLITVPVWGPRCHAALATAVPSLIWARRFSASNMRWLVHTEAPARVAGLLAGHEVEYRPVPPAAKNHAMLGAAHREAIAAARPGEAIMFWCADMVASAEVFAATERRFSEGKKLVMAAATRTLNGTPPMGARARDLLRWTMLYPHPIIEQCFWGSGKCSIPWAIYFTNPANSDVVLRAFHLHPLAMVKEGEGSFEGLTIDFGLASAYKRDEIHVVTDADELALAEMSPLERTIKNLAEPFRAEDVANWARKNTTMMHRIFFADSPIVIRGAGQCGEQAVVNEILRLI